MGTHPIFESDFDCLTEKLLQIHERLKIELDELRREIGRSQSQLNYVKLEIKMPDSDHSDNDDGSQASSTATKGYVTLAELRKYIMMAADEMSTSMKTYLDDNVATMQEQISTLQSELKKEHGKVESLREELRSAQLNAGPSSSGGSSSAPEMVKKRSFDQLVKEVDQCFAELGRQVQREAKHRQSIEQQIQQLELAMPEFGAGGGGGLSPKA